MPFTIAHAAAVLPFKRFSKSLNIAALTIGTMMPDSVYFIPVQQSRLESHSLTGILTYSLPVGFLLSLIYLLFLKKPFTALLPSVFEKRIGSADRFQEKKSITGLNRTTYLKRGLKYSFITVLSLLIGIATHLLWDSFTHQGFWTEALLPFLGTHFFSIGYIHFYGHSILQHGSTVTGLILLAIFAVRWVKKTSPRKGVFWSQMIKHLWWAALVLIPMTLAGFWTVLAYQNGATKWFRSLVLFTVFDGGRIFLGLLGLYLIHWHVTSLIRRIQKKRLIQSPL